MQVDILVQHVYAKGRDGGQKGGVFSGEAVEPMVGVVVDVLLLNDLINV